MQKRIQVYQLREPSPRDSAASYEAKLLMVSIPQETGRARQSIKEIVPHLRRVLCDARLQACFAESSELSGQADHVRITRECPRPDCCRQAKGEGRVFCTPSPAFRDQQLKREAIDLISRPAGLSSE